MSTHPFLSGDFVWCAFPENENPVQPGPSHVGYVVVASTVAAASVFSAMVAYTTSQPWTGPVPPGVYIFDTATAATMGHRRPFVLDLRRMAHLPLTPAWFPRLENPDHGITGRAPKALREAWHLATLDLFTRRPETVRHLGPLRPRS